MKAALQLYLEVDEIEPPLRGVLVGVVGHQQGILEAGDRLAVVRVLCRRVDVPLPDESGSRTVSLQMHGLQGEPVPRRDGIKLLSHGKAADQQESNLRKWY